MNVIEQNFNGDVFAVAYQDSGKFRLSVVNNEGEELSDFDVSANLKLDNLSKPITGFMEPLITCTFINDDIFTSVYHRY